MLAAGFFLLLVAQVPTTPSADDDLGELNRQAHEHGWVRDAFFETDSAALTPDARMSLKASAEWLKDNPDLAILIEGHTDERGTEAYNLALADRRAETAKDFLISLGIDPTQIRTMTYGEERPFDEGHDVNSWSKNRRAHLLVVPSGLTTILGAITGKVVDEGGAVLSAAVVSIVKTSGRHFTVSTVEDGTYRRAGLSPGRYTVSAAKAGFSSVTKSITLAAKGQLEVPFVLPKKQ